MYLRSVGVITGTILAAKLIIKLDLT